MRSGKQLKIGVLTREFPPYVYGGAGVHVDFLVRELSKILDVSVFCAGPERPGAQAFAEEVPGGPDANPALKVIAADVAMTAALGDCDVLHSHTWYANFAGHLGKLLYGVPHVVSAHSLEPLRPWKAEQLGGGYRLSSWAEKTAYEAADAIIAVSNGMRADVLAAYPQIDPAKVHTIYNGIDTELYRPDHDTDVLDEIGVDLARPYVTFVGRITRQKGVPHLLAAARQFAPEVQLVLLAGAADTPELKAETDALLATLHAERSGVYVVSEMLPRDKVAQVLTHAAVFVCPSVYEPLGIVNLEAMACETAVVASDVGGIPEVVVDGLTGTIVHYDAADTGRFESDIAAAVNELVADPSTCARYGTAGRERAREDFGWDAIAVQTKALYESLR
ncbi:glycogen synthase (ADP-glucose) [Antricoccus suffuscus]|uniref:Glycogen synthase (ADP-glucose) n=1 Tax=Antricoccus suffuscus TaxID=1629062 RepID=A0A2T0ZXR4_9ACTN|nr:glycogen synthase [Antricoccus suffuscus]PRZ41037.1 glycogen synthase (ADP-glucose) [Antricoccus suffuscus]